MSDKLNIDKSIKEKFDNFSVAPPPHVWNNIQGQMAAQQKKRRIAYVGWISAAAVVVMAFVAGWFFNDTAQEFQPEFTEERIVAPVQKDNNTEIKNEQQISVDEIISEETEADLLTENSKSINETSVQTDNFDEHSSVAHQKKLEKGESLVESIERISFQFIENIEAVFATGHSEVLLAEYGKSKTNSKTLWNDEAMIAANIKAMDKNADSEKGWIVGAHVSPGYASHSSEHSETYSQDMTYTSDNGGNNVGGGFSVQYKTGKRLRVESGVYYSKDGQKANNSFSLLAIKNDFTNVASEVFYDGEPTFSNLVQTSAGGMTMNSTAGVINMTGTPKGAEISSSVEATDYRALNTLHADGEFSQVFEFVEIPFYLRYSLLNKRFGVELLGGINAGFVVGNNVYLDNQYGEQNIGNTSDISTLNLSGTVGLGLNYAIGKHISLAVEPRFNYYLQSINTNPDVDYRPYRIGVYTGIYYEF